MSRWQSAADAPERPADFDAPLPETPYVIMVVGVNGVGKTTTIGKMAYRYKQAGKKVVLGAADTFRAAAIEQLDVWAERAGVPVVKQKHGADPAALIEARSCERFAKLAPRLDPELGDFYLSLLKSEGRHFQDYLGLAERYSDEPIAPRIEAFAQKEKALIESADDAFRFHSGPLAA